MTTLHNRLIGVDVLEGEKIAIHAFVGAMYEWHLSKLTGIEMINFFTLDTGQQSQANVLKGLLNAAPNKLAFIRVFKNWMYLGETNTDSRYLSAILLNARLEDEVTDQGGTLP